MTTARFWIAVLVTAVVVNALDSLFYGVLMANSLSQIAGMRQGTNVWWFVLGDVAAALVLTLVFTKVRSAFASSLSGGAACGFLLGVFAGFPANHFMYLMIDGYPYWLAWVGTFYTIIWYTLAGTILGAILKPKAVAAGV